MPKTPKEKREIEKDKDTKREKDSWGEDQEKRGYYYDDAYGYDTYDPSDENDDEGSDQ